MDYKIVYETFQGKQVTEWMEKNQAEKFFNKLKGGVLNTIWAELIYSPVDDPNFPDEEEVVAQFTYKVIEVNGRKIIVK